MLRYAKPFFACLLCLLLVAIPCIDNCNAVVTTATVAGVLILTLLVAMGITLVVASGTKEDFILSKGSDFMQSKGYSGAFDSWLLSGSDAEIAMRVGTLYVAKTVVTKAKEFINWLIPNAESDSVHDLSTSEGVLVDSALLYHASVDNGSLVINSVGVYPQEGYTSTDRNTFTDGVNEVYFYLGRNGTWGYTGYYDALTGVRTADARSWSSNLNYRQILVLISTPFVVNNVTHLAGIYTASANITHSPVSYDISYDRYYLDASAAEPDNVMDASAIIGNYNDLDDLVDTTGVGSNNTTVYNTFNLTQSGQAVGQETQDLADIVNALQQALDDLQNKIDVIPVTAEVQEAENIEPPYNDFELGNLNFSALGALLTTRFPFSIPWDLMRIYNLFVTEAEAPHWELNLFADSSLSQSGIDGTVSVDLGNYPIVGTISRWFCIIEFCMFLAFATKKLVWTA